MFTLISTGGPLMWPLILMALIILVLTIKKFYELFLKTENPLYELEYGINAILFWGVISAVFGILAQWTGIYNALSEIIKADDVSFGIMVRGYQVSFITSLFGLQICIVAGVFWFLLRWRYKVLELKRN